MAPKPAAAKAAAAAAAQAVPPPPERKRQAGEEGGAPAPKKPDGGNAALKQMLGKLDYDAKAGSREAIAARELYARLSKEEKQRFVQDFVANKSSKSWKFATTFARTLTEASTVSSGRTTLWLFPGAILAKAGLTWQDFPDSDQITDTWQLVVNTMHADNGREFAHDCQVRVHPKMPKLSQYRWVDDHGTTAGSSTSVVEATARSGAVAQEQATELMGMHEPGHGAAKSEHPAWDDMLQKLAATRVLLGTLQRQLQSGENVCLRLKALGKRSPAVAEKEEEYSGKLDHLRAWLKDAGLQLEEWALLEPGVEVTAPLESLAGLFDTGSAHLDMAKRSLKSYSAFLG
jgi:hypothetical protein